MTTFKLGIVGGMTALFGFVGYRIATDERLLIAFLAAIGMLAAVVIGLVFGIYAMRTGARVSGASEPPPPPQIVVQQPARLQPWQSTHNYDIQGYAFPPHMEEQ